LRGRYIGRNYAAGGAQLSRFLIHQHIRGGGAAGGIGNHGRTLQRDHVRGADDGGVVGGRLAVGLLKPHVPALIESVPFAVSAKRGDQLGGGKQLWRGIAAFPVDFDASVSE
jgi:hypothetical protein